MTDPIDPKGLIREAYRIEGISEGECRSIFLDWAIGRPAEAEARVEIEALLATHAPGAADHPMTKVLTEGLQAAARPARRGGWRARR